MHFGRPAYRNGNNGTIINNGTFRNLLAIRNAVQWYGYGYWETIRNSIPAVLLIAVGTSNDNGYTDSPSFTDHGRAWATMVNNANAWFSSQGVSSRVVAIGASDIEMNFSGPGAARAWVNGYDVNSENVMYNYGDAAGCLSVCDNGWSYADVIWVSNKFGHHQMPMPQIYREDGATAQAWYQIALYSSNQLFRRMYFAGTMAQLQACIDTGIRRRIAAGPRTQRLSPGGSSVTNSTRILERVKAGRMPCGSRRTSHGKTDSTDQGKDRHRSVGHRRCWIRHGPVRRWTEPSVREYSLRRGRRHVSTRCSRLANSGATSHYSRRSGAGPAYWANGSVPLLSVERLQPPEVRMAGHRRG
jgi:hypothetical protein